MDGIPRRLRFTLSSDSELLHVLLKVDEISPAVASVFYSAHRDQLKARIESVGTLMLDVELVTHLEPLRAVAGK